ncbi:isopentenyl-diphosphate Delta-isomerase [Solitalea sp. MAHUQ-68]|uniref:Isopentenyl-diphosphate delta-isomerase n=1 Tax=Solitalea agri TaxID=2953739 RepID=A0A9X2F2Q8_9SPHI|nr:isopentenyl-diphosphate Delta-isomerase [Solitalea agri]MCO4293136.1 isopentenyl-diphosphate Delta-isomerase [Solitalea agri]
MQPQLLLVDENDNVIGYGDKLSVHERGDLHRAFSIFVFNEKNELLIQQRALEKYHSGGLWTNTCCSHPVKGEDLEITLHKKLEQEMGFDCPLSFQYKFIYKAAFDNGLTEHELDHVFVGKYNGAVKPNPEEVADFKWVSIDWLRSDVQLYPENYTEWFKKIIPNLLSFTSV